MTRRCLSNDADLFFSKSNHRSKSTNRFPFCSKDVYVFSWSGSYDDTEIEWVERYGKSDNVFNYRGIIEKNRISGTYKWTYNSAVGSFDFELERFGG